MAAMNAHTDESIQQAAEGSFRVALKHKAFNEHLQLFEWIAYPKATFYPEKHLLAFDEETRIFFMPVKNIIHSFSSITSNRFHLCEANGRGDSLIFHEIMTNTIAEAQQILERLIRSNESNVDTASPKATPPYPSGVELVQAKCERYKIELMETIRKEQLENQNILPPSSSSASASSKSSTHSTLLEQMESSHVHPDSLAESKIYSNATPSRVQQTTVWKGETLETMKDMKPLIQFMKDRPFGTKNASMDLNCKDSSCHRTFSPPKTSNFPTKEEATTSTTRNEQTQRAETMRRSQEEKKISSSSNEKKGEAATLLPSKLQKQRQTMRTSHAKQPTASDSNRALNRKAPVPKQQQQQQRQPSTTTTTTTTRKTIRSVSASPQECNMNPRKGPSLRTHSVMDLLEQSRSSFVDSFSLHASTSHLPSEQSHHQHQHQHQHPPPNNNNNNVYPLYDSSVPFAQMVDHSGDCVDRKEPRGFKSFTMEEHEEELLNDSTMIQLDETNSSLGKDDSFLRLLNESDLRQERDRNDPTGDVFECVLPQEKNKKVQVDPSKQPLSATTTHKKGKTKAHEKESEKENNNSNPTPNGSRSTLRNTTCSENVTMKRMRMEFNQKLREKSTLITELNKRLQDTEAQLELTEEKYQRIAALDRNEYQEQLHIVSNIEKMYKSFQKEKMSFLKEQEKSSEEVLGLRDQVHLLTRENRQLRDQVLAHQRRYEELEVGRLRDALTASNRLTQEVDLLKKKLLAVQLEHAKCTGDIQELTQQVNKYKRCIYGASGSSINSNSSISKFNSSNNNNSNSKFNSKFNKNSSSNSNRRSTGSNSTGSNSTGSRRSNHSTSQTTFGTHRVHLSLRS